MAKWDSVIFSSYVPPYGVPSLLSSVEFFANVAVRLLKTRVNQLPHLTLLKNLSDESDVAQTPKQSMTISSSVTYES